MPNSSQQLLHTQRRLQDGSRQDCLSFLEFESEAAADLCPGDHLLFAGVDLLNEQAISSFQASSIAESDEVSRLSIRELASSARSCSGSSSALLRSLLAF